MELLSGTQAGEDDRDVDVGLESGEPDEVPRERGDLHRLAHLEHDDAIARLLQHRRLQELVPEFTPQASLLASVRDRIPAAEERLASRSAG